MNRLLIPTALLGLTLPSLAEAQCTPRPTHAFAGRVAIPYPKAGGTAAVVQLCDAYATRTRQNVIAAGAQKNTTIRWVEVYGVRAWTSVFHDSIYQLRKQGFTQHKYNQYALPGWNGGETLIYTNPSGKFVAMISEAAPERNGATIFILYGN